MVQITSDRSNSENPQTPPNSVPVGPLPGNGGRGTIDPAATKATGINAGHNEFSSKFRESLLSAERLLSYSAEMGMDVDEATRSAILDAEAADSKDWNKQLASNLLVALAKLAARVRPVTVESLSACRAETQKTVRVYWIVALCLAVLIVPASIATFVTSALSDSIRKDIVTGNELVVKLTDQLGVPSTQSTSAAQANNGESVLPPGVSRVDVITELQTFASTLRTLDTRARQTNWFIWKFQRDPFEAYRDDPEKLKKTLQLPVPLPADLAGVLNSKLGIYQDARSFAQGVVDDVSVFYGAITTCLLPVLYALLGTCAYLLRSFEQDMSNRTFVRSHADSPRFLIAGIGGAVVGLFHSFTISEEASIPPLAIAFLVGYAVDVFFSFLEGLINAFTKDRTNQGTQFLTSPSSEKSQ